MEPETVVVTPPSIEQSPPACSLGSPSSLGGQSFLLGLR
jgi:hypothetical protein